LENPFTSKEVKKVNTLKREREELYGSVLKDRAGMCKLLGCCLK